MTPRPDLLVCHDCDALYLRPPLGSGEHARCLRCGAGVALGHRLTLEDQLALAVGALVSLLIANLTPIVTLDLRGVHHDATLLGSVRATWEAGEPFVALLAVTTALFFPLLLLVARIYVLVPLVRGIRPPAFRGVMRVIRWLTRWSMIEVFMLGALIALVRTSVIARAFVGVGLLAHVVVMLLMTAELASGQSRLWQRSSEIGP